ncbi:hypothetical protein BH20VER2_BH20VER2_07320 [soil metagenome]|nr:hypothetical protein [Chthoniobacterales bacterium]
MQITLHNVNDGARTGAVSGAFSALQGDVNGCGTVTASDVAQVKSRAGEAADETNFRADVVPNGSINASDVGLVKSQSGSSLTTNPTRTDANR